MSAWGSQQWSGSYWGSAGRRRKPTKAKGQGKDQGKNAEKTEKVSGKDKGQFPAYDAMLVEQSSGASSSAGSADAMQRAMRSLLESNPSLHVPKEVEEALGFQEVMNKAAKDSLYEQQRMLNQRRKVTTKIDKLQQALQRKGLQMAAYKDEMKQKLAMELERFHREKQEITEALEQAKLQLAKIEKGEDLDTGMEEVPTETVGGDSLAELLGVTNADSEEVERLKAEKTYAESVAAQLQSQMQFMMQAAAAGAITPLSEHVMGAGGRQHSPQLPGIGAPGLTGMQRSSTRERTSSPLWTRSERNEANERGGGSARFTDCTVGDGYMNLCWNGGGPENSGQVFGRSGSLEVTFYSAVWYERVSVKPGRQLQHREDGWAYLRCTSMANLLDYKRNTQERVMVWGHIGDNFGLHIQENSREFCSGSLGNDAGYVGLESVGSKSHGPQNAMMKVERGKTLCYTVCRERTVKGCTLLRHKDRDNGTYVKIVIEQGYDHSCAMIHGLDELVGRYGVQLWIWIIVGLLRAGSLCSTIIVATNLVITISSRLLFIRFDKHPGAASYEFMWHLARVFVWFGGVILLLQSCSRCRRRRIQVVGKRRVCICLRRPYVAPWRLNTFFVLLLMNGHVIHAIQQYETIGHATEQQFGSSQCNGDRTFGTMDRSSEWYDDDGSNIQSHVDDLWCIDCPSGCLRAPVNRDVHELAPDENVSMVLSKNGLRQHRIPESGAVMRSSLDDAIWQLPETVGDAMWHPRRVRLITAWSELSDILTEVSRSHEQGIRLQTYGIREHFLVVRFASSRGSGQSEIMAAIEATWQQEINGGNFQIHPIRPQPVDTPHDCVALLVAIWSPAIDVDFMAPVVIDTLHYQHRPRSTDGEVIQQVDYLPRHVSTQDFFNTVRLHGVCSTDNYRCVIRTLYNEYVEFPGYVDVEPGFYIIVLAMPREWYQPRGEDMALLDTFSSEATRFSSGTDDDSVFVRVYGVSLSATALGRRSFLLTRHLYSDLDVVRSLAFELWRDVFEQSGRLLVHAPLPTILEPTESVNFILGPIQPSHLVPILASIFTPRIGDAENYLEHGPYAVVVPRDAPFETFRRSFWNSAGQQVVPAPGRVWCEDRYFDFNEELPLVAGTHLLVYDASTESDESSTYTEWSCDETSTASAAMKLHMKKLLWPMMIPAVSMSSSLAAGIIGVGILMMWRTPDVLSKPIMQRFPEDTLVQEPVPWIRPLPDNIWQAIEDRGPRTVFPSYDDLRTDLRAARVHVQQSAILDTYGLLEHSIGLRRIVVPDLDQRTITMAVHQRWKDYSFEYNILLRYVRPQPQPLVMPQPTVSLIVQVLDPLRLPAANMVALLLDQKTALDLEETRQATTVRLAEYVRSPGLGEDVVAAVRLGGSCQPQGLRPCHIVWRSMRRDVSDEIAARPGEYLIVVAGSLEAHFRDSGVYFYRARRFGLEAQRLMRQVFNTHTHTPDRGRCACNRK